MKKWLINLKIGSKITFGFFIVTLTTCIVGALGIIGINSDINKMVLSIAIIDKYFILCAIDYNLEIYDLRTALVQPSSQQLAGVSLGLPNQQHY